MALDRSFEYFCGANITVSIADFPVLECVGLAFEGGETNKRPLYGYASRLFDGVARGQVLYQGSLLVNYVHQDYLFRAIELGLEKQRIIRTASVAPPIASSTALASSAVGAGAPQAALAGATAAAASQAAIESGLESSQGLIRQLEGQYWDTPLGTEEDLQTEVWSSYNPHDTEGGLTIKAVFGRQDTGAGSHGVTGTLLTGVHFLGRGQQIQIDEQVCVERYTFFARNMLSLRNGFQVTATTGPEGTPVYSTVRK